MNIKLPKKYSKLSIAEALETVEQRLTALATRLNRYSREVEASRTNGMFSSNPSKVCSLWQGSKEGVSSKNLFVSHTYEVVHYSSKMIKMNINIQNVGSSNKYI